MKHFEGRVAVVTGAASGIGRAMAFRFAAEGMRVVLADVETGALAETEREMTASGACVLAVPTDVSRSESVEALAQRTLEAFGAVHLLCNNAGVGSPPGLIWERTPADWEWVFGVNVWGVVHGIRVFVPIMLQQGEESHIVNTASMAGFLSGPFLGVYNASKHAVVAISETLHTELVMNSGHVKVSVLCPGMVQTRVGLSERNRPAELANPDGAGTIPAHLDTNSPYPGHEAGIPAAEVAERVLQAVRNEELYVLTHPEYRQPLRARIDTILGERPPVVRESREARLLRLQRSRSS